MYKKLVGIGLAGLLSMPVFAQSGCCSYHHGVDYCGSDGHVYCRDGSQSPTCTCGNQNNISNGLEKTNNIFDIFSLKSMDNPNPYLEPLVDEWVKKNT